MSKHRTFATILLVVYDETELNLEGFVPVTALPGDFVAPDPDMFLQAPGCQAILN
ncbi:MAG TPA: hypothetical protein IGR15_08170 [Synechococcus sp. M44_DOE_062]|nr:hypothetical protein [Synechococcus sp. M44_DOE_062]